MSLIDRLLSPKQSSPVSNGGRSSVTDLEHKAKMAAADSDILEAKKSRYEAARRLAAADKKYKAYARVVAK